MDPQSILNDLCCGALKDDDDDNIDEGYYYRNEETERNNNNNDNNSDQINDHHLMTKSNNEDSDISEFQNHVESNHHHDDRKNENPFKFDDAAQDESEDDRDKSRNSLRDHKHESNSRNEDSSASSSTSTTAAASTNTAVAANNNNHNNNRTSTTSISSQSKNLFQFKFGQQNNNNTGTSTQSSNPQQQQITPVDADSSKVVTKKTLFSFSQRKIVNNNEDDAVVNNNNNNNNKTITTVVDRSENLDDQPPQILISTPTTANPSNNNNRTNKSGGVLVFPFSSVNNNNATSNANRLFPALPVANNSNVSATTVINNNASPPDTSNNNTNLMNLGISSGTSTIGRGINSHLTINGRDSNAPRTPTTPSTFMTPSSSNMNNSHNNSNSNFSLYENQPPPLALPEFYKLRRTLESSYNLDKKISEGTYGEVFHGTCKKTGTKVAVKKLKFLEQLDGFPLTSVREISVLKHLASLDVAKRNYFSVTRDVVMSQNFHDTFLVFDLVEHSLHGLLSKREWGGGAAVGVSATTTTTTSNHTNNSNTVNNLNFFPMWPSSLWQLILLEVCRGLNILHQIGILHRDIKPNNILVSKSGQVKLCDFGLAVGDNQRQRLTPSLIALDFRPPEMLLGMLNYDDRVDVWSVGCLIVNVFIGFPPFFQLNRNNNNNHNNNKQQQQQQQQQPVNKAQNELDQLLLISQRIGIPIQRMMSQSSGEKCTKLDDVCSKIINLPNHNVQTVGANNNNRNSFTGLLLPGRFAPKNEHFEKWIRSQHDVYQTRLLMKQQQQQQQQQNNRSNSGGSSHHSISSNNTIMNNIQPIDAALLDLIVWMLQPDPSQRPKMSQVLEHPYFLAAQREEKYSLFSLKQSLATFGDNRFH